MIRAGDCMAIAQNIANACRFLLRSHSRCARWMASRRVMQGQSAYSIQFHGRGQSVGDAWKFRSIFWMNVGLAMQVDHGHQPQRCVASFSLGAGRHTLQGRNPDLVFWQPWSRSRRTVFLLLHVGVCLLSCAKNQWKDAS